MKKKIIEHAKTEYSSSPHEFNDDQLDLIINHDYSCDNCGKSVFEMNDFPEVLIDEDQLLCEECYDEEYRTVCPLCEDLCKKEDMTEYFFITKETSKAVHKPIGMYKILKFPFYYGDCVFGFDAFFDDAIERVSGLDITEAYALHNPSNGKDILLDNICPDCAERYYRKDFFIKTEPRYCILQDRYRNNTFADYSDEKIHKTRQEMIHRRITLRGMLQKHNSAFGKEAAE